MSRRTRAKAALTPGEWHRAALLGAVVVALHVVGFGLLLGSTLTVGLGLTAYTLGLRHAFDADHIAAIDNTTRKLMADGQRPLSVGFFFSLGHSTVVFAAACLLAAGVRIFDAGPGAVVGPVVSGTFLIGIGLLNLVLLIGIVRSHDGDPALTGPMSRVFGKATRAVRAPWQMYPLGVLFGLGFDTATEIALLATAGSAAASGLPLYAILALPILFAAGMSLLDTLDGAFMSVAYGSSISSPASKRLYSITVTGLSVAMALIVGTIELLAVTGGPEVDLRLVGYVTVGVFVLAWTVAISARRLGRA